MILFSTRGLLAIALFFALAIPPRMPAAHAGLDMAMLQTEPVRFDSLPGYTGAQTAIANRIATRFAAAGYGRVQQIAAVSVAIRESTLNPKAHNRGCRCYGLFQLNRGNGLGTGHSVTDLIEPDYNIRLIIGEADRFQSFKNAGNVEAAITAFVRHVTRPANKSRVIRATIKTARMVERAALAAGPAASS